MESNFYANACLAWSVGLMVLNIYCVCLSVCVDTDGPKVQRPYHRDICNQCNALGVGSFTFIDIYESVGTAYARGEGVWDHRTLFPRKSTFIFNHRQCIIKYCTCLVCGQYTHICRSFMYNNTFEALFLTSKCRGFLWTQTVAPHRGFC